MKKIVILIIVILCVGFIYYKNSDKINDFVFKNDVYKLVLRGSYLKGTDGYKQYRYANINLKKKTADLYEHFILYEGKEKDYEFYTLNLSDAEIKELETLIENIKNNPSNYEYDEEKIKSSNPPIYCEITIKGKVYTVVGDEETKLLRKMINSKGINSKSLEEKNKLK